MRFTEPQVRLVAAAAVVAAAIAAYANSYPNPYVLDDFPAVVHNPGAHWPPDPESILARNYWGSRPHYEKLTIYRPLATFTFALSDGLGFHDCPGSHRAINILLHAACSLLVLLLGLRLFDSPDAAPPQRRTTLLAAAGCALVFAAHPVHSEAVIGIVSRAELLAAFFVLLGTLLYLGRSRLLASPRLASEASCRTKPWRSGMAKEDGGGAACRAGAAGEGGNGVTAGSISSGRLAALGACFALALLSKENGATLWGVVIAIDLVAWLKGKGDAPTPTLPRGGRETRGRGPLRTHIVLAAVLAGYMALRWAVLPALLGGDMVRGDNPIVGAGLLARILTPFKVFGWYLALIVRPVRLTIDYSLNHLPPVESLGDVEALAGLAAFAALAALAVAAARRRPATAIALLGFFATYSVVSNLPFLSTIIMAERLFYLPSAFLLLAMLGGVVATMPSTRRGRAVLAAAALLLAAVFAAGTMARNLDWRTPEALCLAAVRVAPDSAKSRHLLGIELARQGRTEDALPHLQRSVEIDPDNFVARTNLARSLARTGRFDAALLHLEVVLTRAPAYRPALEVLCGIWERTGRPPGASHYCSGPAGRQD